MKVKKIIYKKQYRNNTIYKKKKIIGFDIETIKGKCVLFCNSEKEYIIPKRVIEILRFLTQEKYKNTLNLFYNINYDFTSILKWLGESRINALYIYNRTRWNDYIIEWLSKKSFQIIINKRKFVYYDLFNLSTSNLKYFYTHKKDLNTCAEFWNIKQRKTGEGKEFEKLWNTNKERAIKYCINDCIITREIGKKVDKKLRDINIRFYKWFSWGKISEYYFIKNCNIPTINSFDKSILEMFYKAYKGNWVDILQKGMYKNIYEYDINSAYPEAMRNMIDFRKGFWIKSNGITKDFEKSFYAVIKCRINIKDNDFIPFITVKIKERNINPCGTFTTYITKNEYDIVKDKIEKVYKTYYFIPYEKNYFLRKEIDKLYKLRKKEEFYKVILNSLYGKFCQLNKNKNTYEGITGVLYNPIYASFITTYTRKIIYNKIKNNKKNIISINTDSIFCKKELNIKNSKKIGEWKKKKWSKALFFTNGVYYLENKEIYKQAMRGFSGDLKKLCWNNINKKEIEFNFNDVLSLGLWLKSKDMEIRNLNEFYDSNKKIGINNDVKRFFPDVKNINELLHNKFISMPQNYNYLAKILQ